MRRISRRSMLTGLGASAAALPFIPVLESEAGGGGLYPKRIVLFTTTTGMTGIYPMNWLPTPDGGGGLDMSPILNPLAHTDESLDMRDRCLFLQGIDLTCTQDGPDPGAHPLGMNVLWNGVPLQEGTLFQGGGPDTAGWGDGITVDQYLAGQIGTETAFSSLELGVRVLNGAGAPGTGLAFNMSYTGPAEPVAVENDPRAAWERVFSAFTLSAEDLAAQQAEQQRVIDFVRADLNKLTPKISTADRHKLEAHIDSLASIEDRLYTQLGQCDVPDDPGELPYAFNEHYPTVGQLQMDLLVSSLACDFTRVGSIMWGRTANGVLFNWLPGMETVTEDHHQLSHSASDDEEAQGYLTQIGNWYAGQFAYFLRQLDAIPEGDGTLLDNTLVVWGTEVSTPNNHSFENIPVILAGGGYFRTNELIDVGSQPHNKLLVSLCHAMGQEDMTEFNTSAYGSGPLSGIT